VRPIRSELSTTFAQAPLAGVLMNVRSDGGCAARTKVPQQWLTGPLLCGLVWRHLERHPCRRPCVRDLARALGTTERRLRRACQATGGSSLRLHLTYGCVTYAAQLIASGTKSEAAIRLAGYRSRWNFNRQCRQFGVGSARSCRSGRPELQFSAELVERALCAFEARQGLVTPPGTLPRTSPGT
jgi:AraC-like DNA-binding protein